MVSLFGTITTSRARHARPPWRGRPVPPRATRSAPRSETRRLRSATRLRAARRRAPGPHSSRSQQLHARRRGWPRGRRRHCAPRTMRVPPRRAKGRARCSRATSAGGERVSDRTAGKDDQSSRLLYGAVIARAEGQPCNRTRRTTWRSSQSVARTTPNQSGAAAASGGSNSVRDARPDLDESTRSRKTSACASVSGRVCVAASVATITVSMVANSLPLLLWRANRTVYDVLPTCIRRATTDMRGPTDASYGSSSVR